MYILITTSKNSLFHGFSKQNTAILHATSSHEFVNPYRDPAYFWAKCFPFLYPYGRGCPSDPDSLVQNLRLHNKQMLMRGGGPQGRRFQQYPNYYFAAYHYESRRKLGGIVSKAQNSKYDGLSENDDTVITASILSQMKTYAEEQTQNHQILHSVDKPETENLNNFTESDENEFRSSFLSSSSSSSVLESTSNSNDQECNTNTSSADTTNESEKLPKMTKQEYEFYCKRLAVYGKSLPGTSLHMKTERNNLMSMLASPTVDSDGIWRWFITLSPADLYDPRLYEILAASDEEFLDWESRKVKARNMTKEERIYLLSQHPALYARLFELQSQCFWDYAIGSFILVRVKFRTIQGLRTTIPVKHTPQKPEGEAFFPGLLRN